MVIFYEPIRPCILNVYYLNVTINSALIINDQDLELHQRQICLFQIRDQNTIFSVIG